MGYLDSFPMDITCGGCGHKHQKTVAWMKHHDKIACPVRDHTDAINDDHRRALAAAEKDVDDLAKSINKINKV